jgi:hypothetical protein
LNCKINANLGFALGFGSFLLLALTFGRALQTSASFTIHFTLAGSILLGQSLLTLNKSIRKTQT